MRVGLALYGSLDEQSGGFRYDRKLVEGLRTAGDSVELVELPWRDYHRGLLDNGARTVRRRLDVGGNVMLQDELAEPWLGRTNSAHPYPTVRVGTDLGVMEPRRRATLSQAR